MASVIAGDKTPVAPPASVVGPVDLDHRLAGPFPIAYWRMFMLLTAQGDFYDAKAGPRLHFCRCFEWIGASDFGFGAGTELQLSYCRRPDEVLICQDSHLSALDERMSSLYFSLRNSLRGAEHEALETAQASWLRSRIACGRDFQCIEVRYERRIKQLADY
jgi:hypothetical protein